MADGALTAGARDIGRARERDLPAQDPLDDGERQQQQVEREGEREADEQLVGEAERRHRVEDSFIQVAAEAEGECATSG